MAGGFMSEWWAASFRYGGRLQIGMEGEIARNAGGFK
jgi:hypothetical protein